MITVRSVKGYTLMVLGFHRPRLLLLLVLTSLLCPPALVPLSPYLN